MSNWRSYLITGLKLGLATSLIVWLLSTGKLDFLSLKIFWEQPRVLAAVLGFWIAALILCTLRWRCLLSGLRFILPFNLVCRLNMVGLFFTSVMPGALGGDLVKAVYVCRGRTHGDKLRFIMSILLDRVIGLMAVFLLSVFAIIWHWDFVWAFKELRPIIILILSTCFGFGAMFFLFYRFPIDEGSSRVVRWVLHIKPLWKLYSACSYYRERPKILAQALGLSLLHQFFFALVFFYISTAWVETEVSFSTLMVVLPLGITSSALPLAPGGLGLSHAVFERLFALIGLHGGANIFNVFFVAQMSLNLLGLIPYLTMKGELKSGSEEGSFQTEA